MHEDDDNPRTEHSEGEHLGCTVVAIYAAAAVSGLLVLAAATAWAGWWQGLIVIAVILGLSAVLWALLRMGARGTH